MDERAVKDVTSSQTLVLLYRICTFSDSSSYSVDDQYAAVRAILETIPLGRDNREAQLGALAPEQGNPVLAGYDCIIWVVDALQTLAEAGIFRVEDLNMQSAGTLYSILIYCSRHHLRPIWASRMRRTLSRSPPPRSSSLKSWQRVSHPHITQPSSFQDIPKQLIFRTSNDG